MLPVSFVGGIAFCCVCTAGGFVSFNIAYSGGDTTLVALMYGAMYVGLAAGLLASLFLLKHFNYLSQVETIALQQDTTPPSEQSVAD